MEYVCPCKEKDQTCKDLAEELQMEKVITHHLINRYNTFNPDCYMIREYIGADGTVEYAERVEYVDKSTK